MTRQANQVDFWRGLALVFIFVNHIPGIYYAHFTHASYSLSDSADLFVFLAGWALRYVVGRPGREPPAWYLVLRLGGRALTLYAAQIMITMIAIAMLAGVALWRDNPLLLEWHNAAAVFHDPVPTHVGLALVTEPKLLLLDEPMGGLTEEENAGMMRLVQKIRGEGISILLIEHKMKVVMKISDRIVVLNYGRKIAEGTPGEVGRNPEVVEAYLGVGDAE